MDREDEALKNGKFTSNPALKSKDEAGQPFIPQLTEEEDIFFDQLFEEDSKDAENEFFEVPDDGEEEFAKDIFRFDEQLLDEPEEKLEATGQNMQESLLENEDEAVTETLSGNSEADLDELLGKIGDITGNMKNEADEKDDLQSQDIEEGEIDIEELLGGLFSDTMEAVPGELEEPQKNAMDLLNSVPEKDPLNLMLEDGIEKESAAASDILSMNDFMDGMEEQQEGSSYPADTSSDHPEDILNRMPDMNEVEQSGEKKKKKKKEKTGEKVKKRGIFSRIFGNIRKERTEEEVKHLKDKVYADADAKEKAELEKEEKKKQQKVAAEANKKKAAEEKKKKEAEAKKAKAEKAKAAKAAKEAKKEAKIKKQQEIQNLIDEIDENEGRINKAGATVIFLFFIILAGVIIIGTNAYSYENGIKTASDHFQYKHYDEAYESICGLDLKEEDQELYNKIVTVMYVKKQLNSYQNYYNMELYPEAMDSLVKGLRRYDKYIDSAKTYEIDDALNTIKNQILSELKTVFHLTKKEALALSKEKDQTKYSMRVYSYVSERFVPPVKETEPSEEGKDETDMQS